MTSAWMLGAAHAQPQREDEARATTEVVRTDGPAAEKNDANASGPDWNEFESDPSEQLTGLASRMLVGETVESKQSKPWWTALADENLNALIDNKIASSGTAAHRENAGQQGHGTMQYTMDIEPVIREGGAMGADYFASHEMDVQEGAGVYMVPPTGITSRWGATVDAQQAANNSRDAYQGSLYQAFLDG